MKHYFFFFSAVALLRCFLFFAAFPFPSHSKYQKYPRECTSKLYSCGDNIRNLSFPFRGDTTPETCGDTKFELRCIDSEYALIDIQGLEFRVLHVNQTNRTMNLARNDLFLNPCSLPKIPNTTLDPSLFAYDTTRVANLTLLYHCSEIDGNNDMFSSFWCDDRRRLVYINDSSGGSVSEEAVGKCGVVTVPVSRAILRRIHVGEVEVIEGFKEGFEVNYLDFESCKQCSRSHGSCGFNSTAQFQCTCSKGSKLSYNYGACVTRNHHGFRNWELKGTLVATGMLVVLLFMCFTRWCYMRRKSILSTSNRGDQDIPEFIRDYGNLTAKIYKYSELKKITKSFKDKLGEGGYGEVYKGELRDGRVVAVKILNSSKGNGEEFLNEVVSISRTSHVNIVALLGFCYEGRKRALVYEFMPNGSLEKFVYNENASRTRPNLPCAKMIEIATGIARGLEYLHRGCNTRIFHFDIKPHNILLDEDLSPKISDFGLAKLCPNKESCMSLLNARGTIGYIAPEVCNRNFGAISSKSDVYSYGMMILEMVGGRKNIRVEASSISQIYFPDWIYNQLELGSNLRLWGDMTDEENRAARKMIIVGLWCIQIAPSDRPSMSKVIEMLEGNLEALRIPTKPTLSSPRSSDERLFSNPATSSFSSSTL